MPEQQSTTGSELSFERAEFEGPAAPPLVCAFCSKPLTGQYWQISARAACEDCRGSISRELDASRSRASFVRALGYGSLAALVGSVAWIAIEKLFHVQIGIVAIGVGYLVGKAVRKGSGGLGGTRYQVLALALTYVAITFSSLPDLVEAVNLRHAQSGALSGAPATSSLFTWVALIGVALAFPFLQGTANIIGIFIIGIGLYEAWKYTRPVSVQVLGPFSAAPQPAPPFALGSHAAD
jgi:hypothetical protein